MLLIVIVKNRKNTSNRSFSRSWILVPTLPQKMLVQNLPTPPLLERVLGVSSPSTPGSGGTQLSCLPIAKGIPRVTTPWKNDTKSNLVKKQRKARYFHLMICSFSLEAPRKITNTDIENKKSLYTCTNRNTHNTASQANRTYPRCWTSASHLGVQIPMHRFGKLRLPEQNLMLPKDMLFDIEDPCVFYIQSQSFLMTSSPPAKMGWANAPSVLASASQRLAPTQLRAWEEWRHANGLPMDPRLQGHAAMLCKYSFQTICCGCFP